MSVTIVGSNDPNPYNVPMDSLNPTELERYRDQYLLQEVTEKLKKSQDWTGREDFVKMLAGDKVGQLKAIVRHNMGYTSSITESDILDAQFKYKNEMNLLYWIMRMKNNKMTDEAVLKELKEVWVIKEAV